MDIITPKSILYLLMCLISHLSKSIAFVVPNPNIELLSPRGVRVSIPDEAGIQLVVFNGNVNKNLRTDELGLITSEIYQATNGRWIFEDPRTSIQPSDTLNYWLLVQFNGAQYKKQGSWKKSLETSQTSSSCVQSITTTAHGETVCKGQLIFIDTFETLNSSIWSREVLIPADPNYDFGVYHNHVGSVQVQNGSLQIIPSLLEDSYGEGATGIGHMTLAECTSPVKSDCSRKATAYLILPPVISARLTTVNHFSFRYGRIAIRAKFPEGDWLYPELWLRPKHPEDGELANSRIRLGMARGNRKLRDNQNSFDGRLLEFGLRTGSSRNFRQFTVRKLHNRISWTSDYHVYVTTWNPDSFVFHVDGEEVSRLDANTEDWFSAFHGEFYITLGIGIGGAREFTDNTISGVDQEYVKPWKNVSAKVCFPAALAMLRFWQAKSQWVPSWRLGTTDNANLKIDYIRVWAL